MKIDVLKFEESREIIHVRRQDGFVESSNPKPGSERFYFELGFPDGSKVKVPVTKMVYELFLEEAKNASNTHEMS